MDTDTGWSQASGESTGRWRTILARASGRASVPGPDDEAEKAPPQAYGAPPAYPAPGQPAGYPAAPSQPAAYPPVPNHPGAYPPAPSQPAAYPSAPSQPGAYPAAASPAAYPAPSQPAAYPPPAPAGASHAAAYDLPPGGATIAQRSTPAIEWRTSPTAGGPDGQALSILRREIVGGAKVIAFANPKGGVHKTTATVLAAAAIGGARGRGVVAWDDNELRGTLGLRAGSARHARTIKHLVTELAEVEMYAGDELIERMDDFLRHASDGSYDVLAGEEDSRFAWRLDPQTVRRVLDLLTRTHELICVDTGNNVESANWQTVMQSSDQLVITTVPREDSAFAADWMMDLLIEAGLGDLVANAVTLVSLPTPRPSPMVDDLVRHFATRNRAVCVVPYDPSLEIGGWIDHTVLQPATRQAWLQAAATIVEPFGR